MSSKATALQAEGDFSNLPALSRIADIKDSKTFLEECTYFIGLTDLYKVHSTCHYNEGMIYCPVLVEITSAEIKRSYDNANYILQVWKRLGKKVFQIPLKAPVSLWSICFNFFVYKPSSQDPNSKYYHIIDLKEPEKVYLIQDFVNSDPQFKYITFAKNLLYLASDNEIKVAEVILSPENINNPIIISQEDVFTIKLENEREIGTPCKLWGLYLNSYTEGDASVVTAIETIQSQVDFSFLNVEKSNSINGGSKFTHSLLQYREVIKKFELKDRASDKIKKFDAIIQSKSKFIVACALRESGAFDIYYNAFRVSSSPKDVETNQPILAHDIELSFDTVYLKMKTDYFQVKHEEIIGKKKRVKITYKNEIQPVFEGTERVRAIHNIWENKMNYENSEYDCHYSLRGIFYQRVKTSCNIFNSFNLIGTVLVVAHGKMISIYSILTEKWIKTFTFDSEIVSIFRNPGMTTVLLANNKLKVLKSEKKSKDAPKGNDDDQEQWVEVDESVYNLRLPPGKVSQYAFDLEDNKYVLFLITNGAVSTLMVLYEQKLYDITKSIKKFGDNKTKKNNLFFLFSDSDVTEFVLQIGKSINIYSIEFLEDKPEEVLKNEAEEADKLIDEQDDPAAAEKDEEQKKKELAAKVVKHYPLKPVITLKTTVKAEKINTLLTFGIRYSLKKHEIVDSEEAEKKKAKLEKKEGKDKKAKDSIDTSYLIVGDHHNFFKIFLKNNQCTVFPNQNCIGVYFSDKNYLYTLAHRSAEKRAGFRLYDVENVVEHDKDFSYTLSTSVQVGCQGFIDYSASNQRIVFQANFEQIEIVPLLHRNTISYIGMKPRTEFLSSRIISGKLYALSIKGKLSTWDLLTGKPIPIVQQKKDLSQYEIYAWGDEDMTYKKEWFDKILLKKKTPIQVDEALFFGAKDKNIKGQVSYIDKQPKQFFEFKLIEIQESGVKEHFDFIFPVFNGVMQFMFFSQDLQSLYLRLRYERQFIYSRQEGKDGRVSWTPTHRFGNIPVDIMNITQYPFIFSPNFTKYIDIDNSHTNFIIRKVDKEETIISKIPDRLMSSQIESLRDQASRFRWIDENTIHVINQQGIERLIDITDKDYREIEFNIIPLYDRAYCKKAHYTLDPPTVPENQTLERLKRKYQQYKSAYYLQNALERKNNGEVSEYLMNKNLFSVDFRINQCQGRYVSDISFTFLHWNLMEQLGSGKITFDQIDNQQVENLFYNILPGGNTILHKLHANGDLLEKLMQIAHPDAEDRTKIGIHVPVLPNFKGKSAFHLCVDGEEYRYINMFLEYLQGYDIDHHSRAIIDELHICIEHNLPNLIPYLESRVKQTDMIKKITKGMLKVTNVHNVCASQLWTTQQDIDQILQPAPIEQDLKLSFLDIPQLHSFTSESAENFFAALSETEDMKLFETHAVKKLIEFKWPLIFEYTVTRLFVPFFFFLTFFMTVMHSECFLPGKRDESWAILSFAGLIIFAIYLLAIEALQLYKSGFEYFGSFWNYLDIVPPVMILVFLYLALVDHYFDDLTHGHKVTTMVTLQAIMSLLIWLKFLYFLRIFQATSYLIRIVIEVVIDMRHFLLILLLTFIAFGDAIYYINIANPPDDGDTQYQFIGGQNYFFAIAYVYRMVLGDFATDAFGIYAVPLMWILFLLCTVFNMIIMLNLLIAIISESFARVNEDREQAGYQERAKFISENLYLVPVYRRERYCAENRYLLFAVDQEAELAEYQETMDDKLKSLKKNLKTSNTKIATKLKKQIKKAIKKNNSELFELFKGKQEEKQ